jgi:hypothetical protein
VIASGVIALRRFAEIDQLEAGERLAEEPRRQLVEP